jgi:NodT family efflux transporter outer membrane factor (OMF) lipoprotein
MRNFSIVIALSFLLATPVLAADALPARPAQPVATPWWHRLGDTNLAWLVDKALADNPDIGAVAARLDQAQAATSAVRAGLLPSFGASGSAAVQQQSLEDPAIRPFANLPGFPRTQERFSAGLSASWEIDLFGGNARRRSAGAQAEAAAADVDAARVAIAAQTASTWLSIRALQAQRGLQRATLSAIETQAALISQRAAAGVAAAIEQDQIAAERAGQLAAIAELDGAIASDVEGLGVLIADADAARSLARRFETAQFQQTMPDLDRLSISIASRPDVIAAERRLTAADAAVGAARSARFPRLSLGSLLATIATGPAALFTGAAQAAQGSGMIALPLFDFGRIDAAIADARGNRKAVLAAARMAGLAAAADVARSAAMLDARRKAMAAQHQQFSSLSAACVRQEEAEANGVIDKVAYLDFARRCHSSESSLVAAQADAMKALVSVLRSTGDLRVSVE